MLRQLVGMWRAADGQLGWYRDKSRFSAKMSENRAKYVWSDAPEIG
ncbi:hypothetical protein [Ruegeria sp. 6PALISEP08]|nr:hypothetical protein [Ruegeria sp. 6PALISEP08]